MTGDRGWFRAAQVIADRRGALASAPPSAAESKFLSL
jgi:hypothetical protein